MNHISRSWRLSSPPSRGTIQEPRASNLLYNVNRRLSNLSMHSKRPHALKPRPGGNNFVTVRCAVIEDEKWNNQKDLHHLVTFATRAKCLTEGLNKYMCGPTCPLHPTQSEIQNYQIRLQNPGAAKSLCNIFVSVPISLSFFFFRSLFFLLVCLHGALSSWTRIHSLRTSQRSTSCSLSTDLPDTSSYTHRFYSRNKFN